ncbi:FAD-dependent oxidoreductase [Candidatus Dependentiae bacterium]|nr:FAD-dependent oxidoreductase [Candidatus Dependentiae bacterium]MBU4387477.1 FAD-dependent oxidoreductase [Candidatus Dependentiae bacterium]MCG2756496.1 FAD-dependent oxidoreductase [Candidatus Dependentiae bacterium]
MNAIKNVTLVICLFFLVGCLNYSSSKNIKRFNIDNIKYDKQTYPVVIIGGGIGGLTSSIYLSQANIKHILIEGQNPGGAITSAHAVCNWPGEKNISGSDLMDKIKNHAKDSGANISAAKVTNVDFSTWPYLIKIIDNDGEKTISAISCIIATGATPNMLNIPGEEKYFGRGVSKCATCDGSFYKNKTVAIVGGGNTAISDALYLSEIAQKIYLIVRKDFLRAAGKMTELVKSYPNIEILYNTNVKEVIGDDEKVTGLKIYNSKENKESEILVDAMFLAIGATPNSKLFSNQVEMDNFGYLTVKNGQKTSKSGIFAVGDICEPEYKQLIIASGQGAKAAMQAQKFLGKIGYKSENLKEKSLQTKQPEKQPVKVEQPKIEKQPEPVIEKNEASTQTVTVIDIKSAAQFEKEVLNYKGNVVADFYAHWCPPCKMMAPIVDELANEFGQTIKFVKSDVSKIGELGANFGIRGVPTFIFFKDGKEIFRFSGAREKEVFKELIENQF